MSTPRLSDRQRDALRALAAEPPSVWLGPAELGRRIGLNSFSTAKTVGSLVNRGLVHRDRTPGYPVAYAISSEGRQVVEGMTR